MNAGINLDLILIVAACVIGFLIYRRNTAVTPPRPILAPAPVAAAPERTSLTGGLVRTAEDLAYNQADQLIVGGLAKLKAQRFAQDLQVVTGTAAAVPTSSPPVSP